MEVISRVDESLRVEAIPSILVFKIGLMGGWDALYTFDSAYLL